jgi:hypothetical protein
MLDLLHKNVPSIETTVLQEDRDTQTQITLNYVDKLFAASQRLAEGNQRYSLMTAVLSLILLSLSGSAAHTGGALSISGIGLKVPLTVFLVLGTFIISVLVFARAVGERHAALLNKEIRRLYASIGFEDSTLHAQIASPFRGESAVDLLVLGLAREHPVENPTWRTRNALILGEWVLQGTVRTAAQVGAGFKVSELLQQGSGPGWVWILFVFAAYITPIVAGALRSAFFSRFSRMSRSGKAIALGGLMFGGLIGLLPGLALGYFVVEILGHLLVSQ